MILFTLGAVLRSSRKLSLAKFPWQRTVYKFVNMVNALGVVMQLFGVKQVPVHFLPPQGRRPQRSSGRYIGAVEHPQGPEHSRSRSNACVP